VVLRVVVHAVQNAVHPMEGEPERDANLVYLYVRQADRLAAIADRNSTIRLEVAAMNKPQTILWCLAMLSMCAIATAAVWWSFWP
jgi:hypothetical protein